MQLRRTHLAWTGQYRIALRLVSLAYLLASGVCAFAGTAVVSGVVRDAQGVAQMGAMVQVLAGSGASVATAFTDLYGRYRISNLVPGRYQVRATAAMFIPAVRANLRFASGARATVNLTLTMLSDPAAWLPAERRKPDEPGDDWSWTMRSAANRPILRMTDKGEVVLVSSSAAEPSNTPSVVAREAMMSGDGGFGGGGSHDIMTIDRVSGDGADIVMRTDIAAARTPYGRGPAVEMDTGYERSTMPGGASRLVVSYESHPEMMSSDGSLGMQMLRMASAEKMKIGPALEIEAGGTVYAVRTTDTAHAVQPFVRITVHPGEVWAVRYRLATSRDVQGFEGLDSVVAEVPMAAEVHGKLVTERGHHQELAVSRRFGPGLVQAAVYEDSIGRSLISGTGVMGATDMSPGGLDSTVVADTVTDSFALLGQGYSSHGVSLVLSEPLTTGLWAALEYQNGSALATQGMIPSSLADETATMRCEKAASVTAAVKGRLVRSDTKLRIAYRWQPRRLLTPVASYEAFSDQAFLSFYIRQALHWGNRLPPGLEATIDVTNLLAQGYQPFLSADGRTLYLAQSPRTLQAGLAFKF